LLTEKKYLTFIKDCEVYIDKLKSENKLIAAQPLIEKAFKLKKLIINGRKMIFQAICLYPPRKNDCN